MKLIKSIFLFLFLIPLTTHPNAQWGMTLHYEGDFDISRAIVKANAFCGWQPESLNIPTISSNLSYDKNTPGILKNNGHIKVYFKATTQKDNTTAAESLATGLNLFLNDINTIVDYNPEVIKYLIRQKQEIEKNIKNQNRATHATKIKTLELLETVLKKDDFNRLIDMAQITRGTL